MTQWIISDAMHEAFASLSGDRNPMHMDAVAARRMQPGDRVVHGVHTLLRALETLAAAGQIVSPLARVRVRFMKWIYPGSEVFLSAPAAGTIDPARLQVEVEGMAVLVADLTYGEPSGKDGSIVESAAAPLSAPLDLKFDELKDRTGEAYTASANEVSVSFPHLAALIGAVAVSEMISCSYIVGMEAPGLYSMFSKLDLSFVANAAQSEPRKALHYTVTYCDERFQKARIAVAGAGVSGTLEVFMRERPVEQGTMDDFSARVTKDEFASMRALVIGGSRGLGEVVAKLIAAGGGTPTVTYALGQVEAERVVAQIQAYGGSAHTLRYDVRQDPAPQLEPLAEVPTHLFYFATGTIYRQKLNVLSPALLAEFIQFYVQGFYSLCTALLEKRTAPEPLSVLYPSTVFIEERPAGMTEYAMAKAAGEQLCTDMQAYMPGIKIIASRLPKLPTDQTAGILPEQGIDSIGVLLPLLREMVSPSS